MTASLINNALNLVGDKHRKVGYKANGGSAAGNQERNITIMLLVISFVFVAMNLPSHAMRLRLFFTVLAHGAEVCRDNA